MSVIADTTVLVDLWRYRRDRKRLSDLNAKLNEPKIPFQVIFEFARGAIFRGIAETVVDRFLSQFDVIPTTEDQVMEAARIDAGLRKIGAEIGSADVWIAAAALETGLPIVTSNVRHFSRVSGIVIIDYSILP